jgi:hypothetical protein
VRDGPALSRAGTWGPWECPADRLQVSEESQSPAHALPGPCPVQLLAEERGSGLLSKQAHVWTHERKERPARPVPQDGTIGPSPARQSSGLGWYRKWAG